MLLSSLPSLVVVISCVSSKATFLAAGELEAGASPPKDPIENGVGPINTSITQIAIYVDRMNFPISQIFMFIGKT